MTVSYLVFYQGNATDNAAFVERYLKTHVPILRTFPKIIDVRVHTPLSVSDTHAVNAGGFLLVCEMVFSNATELGEALASPERSAARADFEQFPNFDGNILHQAMQTQASRD
jgi:uncharacterized protein (TIGR02118 family)